VDSRTTEAHQRKAQNKRPVAPKRKNENEQLEKAKARPNNIMKEEKEQRSGHGEGETI